MSLFFTGTDTGVGKTHTVIQLLRLLRASGKPRKSAPGSMYRMHSILHPLLLQVSILPNSYGCAVA